MNAIIGHTGFVGGILKKSIDGDYFNRENIKNIFDDLRQVKFADFITNSLARVI